MAVLIEAVSVVVRRDAIEKKAPGGWNQFVESVPNAAFCYDDSLASVGFMADRDAGVFLSHLQALGLSGPDGSGEVDIAIVCQHRGFVYEVPWLGAGRIDSPEIGGAVLVAFVKGLSSIAGSVAVPGPWRYEGSLSQTSSRVVDDPAKAGLKFLRKEGKVDVYWDEKVGRELYVANTYQQSSAAAQLDAATVARRDQILDKADGLAGEARVSELLPPASAGWLAGRKIRRAVELYEQAIAQQPDDWGSHWKRAKCLQALGEYQRSLDGFSQAWLLNPSHVDIAREAGISAAASGRHDIAIYYSQEALKLIPTDTGLRVNLAMAYLFAGNLVAATKEVEDAAMAEPPDAITRAVQVLIQEVAAGRMRRPAHAGDVDQKALKLAISGR